MQERLRRVVSNPEAAATVIPEAAEQIASLKTQEEREQFVLDAVRHMAEQRMQGIADLMPPGDYLEVHDADGRVVAARLSASDFPWPSIPAGETFGPAEYHAEPYLTHVQPFEVEGQVYTFYTATSLVPIKEIADEMLAHLHWAIILFLLLSTLGGWMIASRALRPVDEITRTARSISIEDLSHRLEVPQTGDELERLASTWNGMLERLERAVEQLNQFTADASHELRTPTAVIRTTAELSLRRERAPEDYRASLEKIHRESGRMTQLVEDLLTLARADSSLYELPMSAVTLEAIANDVLSDYKVLAEAKRLTLTSEMPETATELQGNEATLRRLLVVLLDNAIKYTHAGGTVSVRVTRQHDRATLEISDSGIGIPPEDQSKIFDRFYRSDRSRSRSTGSYGLGLSVARWIAERHGATMSVESAEGEGSTFRVIFPLPLAARRAEAV
jgi:heavy metal sensor kinase